MNQKWRLLAIGFACASVLVGTVVANAATGTPEIDRANATIKFSGTLKGVGCVGEDNTDYVTYSGAWNGSINQMLPDATDYKFTGAFLVTGISWTINSQSQRGVLTGQVTLGSAATGAPVYKGKLTLITQGRPSTAAQVPGRGWINALAQPADEGATPSDDSLLANVEFLIGPAGGSGEFGDVPGSMGVRDYSVVTNVAPQPLDGVC